MTPGDLVTPSIRLVRMLGQGGMGSVWVAEHERLRTEVVVKFIVGEYAKHPEALARFEREATLAAQAKSPHVVQVFDHGVSQDGLPYIAMELLEGEDLAERIQREKLIEPDVFVDWFRQAASGLSRAHKKGIVHRDIKPENIFLCNEDDDVLVKVLDFGIAKSDVASTSFSGTRTGAMLGTAYYMSPEQTMGSKDIDHRADLWAMGVVAYYALTGVRPFDGEVIGQLVMAITQLPIAPPSSYNAALTPAVDVWMKKALAREPAERFSSAKEMSEALSQAVLGRIPSQRKSFGIVSDSGTSDAPPPGGIRSATTLSRAASVISKPEPPLVVPVAKPSRILMMVVGGASVVAAAALAWGVVRSSQEAEPEELKPFSPTTQQGDSSKELRIEPPPQPEEMADPAPPEPEPASEQTKPEQVEPKPEQVEPKPEQVEPKVARPSVRPTALPGDNTATLIAAPSAETAPPKAATPATSAPSPTPKPKPKPKPAPPPKPATPLHMAIE